MRRIYGSWDGNGLGKCKLYNPYSSLEEKGKSKEKKYKLRNTVISPFIAYPSSFPLPSFSTPRVMLLLTNQVEGNIGLTCNVAHTVEFIKDGVNNPIE